MNAKGKDSTPMPDTYTPTTEELTEAIAAAKVAAGLDPAQAYSPNEWIDHLAPKMHRAFWRSQVDRVFDNLLERTRHNHFTRDVKAPGKCPKCDESRARLSSGGEG